MAKKKVTRTKSRSETPEIDDQKVSKRKSEEIDETKLKLSRTKSKSDFEELGDSSKIKNHKNKI